MCDIIHDTYVIYMTYMSKDGPPAAAARLRSHGLVQRQEPVADRDGGGCEAAAGEDHRTVPSETAGDLAGEEGAR